jgi:hypothetical protein
LFCWYEFLNFFLYANWATFFDDPIYTRIQLNFSAWVTRWSQTYHYYYYFHMIVLLNE